jgi:hypothetical protein
MEDGRTLVPEMEGKIKAVRNQSIWKGYNFATDVLKPEINLSIT